MLDIYQTATDEDLVKPKKWRSKVSLTSDIFSIYSQSLANDDVLSLSLEQQITADQQIARKERVCTEQSKHTEITAREHTQNNKSTLTKEVRFI